MTEKRHISKATSILGSATLLSRISGLVRDMVIGRLFGAGFSTDAFFMAFTLPNLLRRFFAEGSLTASFVPTYSHVLETQGREEAQKLARICLTALLLVMLVVTAAGVIGSPLLVRLIGFGFAGTEGKLLLTNLLNRIMFPYILFASLLALATGVLNVFGHYFLPALSPILLNLAMIACAWLLSPMFDPPILALAIGVFLGGLLQVLVQWPVLARHQVGPRLDFRFGHPALRQIARLMLPGIAGVAIYQINVVVTRLLASFLPEGSVSYLYYGQRLFEFPQGVFIVSLAQAVLPTMSRQAAIEDFAGLKQSLDFALKLITVVTLPAAVGLILCAVPVYSLFFMSGAFDFEAVQKTSWALSAYAPGLFFLGIARVVAPTFYALKDTRTPVVISFWTMLINAGLGLVLMHFFGHTGLALALTLATLCNCLLLVWALRKKIGRLGLRSLLDRWVRLLIPVSLMGAAVQAILSWGHWQVSGNHWAKGAILLAAVVGGGLVYGCLGLLFRVPEIRDGWAFFSSKISRRSRL